MVEKYTQSILSFAKNTSILVSNLHKLCLKPQKYEILLLQNL